MEKLKKKGAEEQREYYPGWREGRGGVRQEVGEIKHLFKWQACFGASRLARIPSSTYTHLIYVLFSAVFRARVCVYTAYTRRRAYTSFTCVWKNTEERGDDRAGGRSRIARVYAR